MFNLAPSAARLLRVHACDYKCLTPNDHRLNKPKFIETKKKRSVDQMVDQNFEPGANARSFDLRYVLV